MNSPDDRPHFVYLISEVRRKKFKIKIGRTWNIDVRMKDHGYGKKTKPKLHGFIVCKDLWESQRVELSIHQWIYGGPLPKKKDREWHDFDYIIVRHFFRQKGAVVCL